MEAIRKYTGNKIKIAVIDDGYIKTDDSINVLMYDYLGKEVGDSNSESFHGKQCIEIIKTHAANALIYSINAIDHNTNKITEYTITKAINLAISFEVDIINISQGLDSMTHSLDVAIQQAKERNILICAARNPDTLLTYPSDLNEVLRIEMSKDVRKVSCINETFFVPREEVYFFSNSNKINPIGNSFATAYISALCAKILEFNPLTVYDSVVRFFSVIDLPAEKYNSLNLKNIAVLNYDVEFDIKEFIPYLKENIKYYYDHLDGIFKEIRTNKTTTENDISIIFHINPFSIRLEKKSITFSKKDFFFGQFKENIIEANIKSHNYKLNYIDKPIVAIMGYGENMDKFNIQAAIYSGLIDNNVKVANFSFNPLVEIFKNSFHIDFPEKIEYPNYIYQFNNKIHTESKESDILLFSFPGAIDYFHNNSHNIGKLYKLLLASINIDIIILSISDFISYRELQERINELTNIYGAKVYLYICKRSKTFDVSNILENAEIHLLTDTELKKLRDDIQNKFPDLIIFDRKDLLNQKLFNEIVRQLS